jgi:hypothetical protein
MHPLSFLYNQHHSVQSNAHHATILVLKLPFIPYKLLHLQSFIANFYQNKVGMTVFTLWIDMQGSHLFNCYFGKINWTFNNVFEIKFEEI